MKKISFGWKILFFTLIVSCDEIKGPSSKNSTSSTNWTEAEKWKYFQDSLAFRLCNEVDCDGLNNFYYFSDSLLSNKKAVNNHNAIIYAMEEPYIDTTCIELNKFWFRIIVTPTGENPYCLVVEKKNKRTYLTGKITNGAAGYFPGLLKMSTTLVFPDSVYDNLSKNLNKYNFWSLGKDSSVRVGIDGETWMFEAIENGRYNCIKRWTPLNRGNPTTRALANMTMKYFKKSKFIDFYSLVRSDEISSVLYDTLTN